MSDNLDGSDEEISELEESTEEGQDAAEELETVEIDGEKVTLEELKEWKLGKMRLDDYTRKTMEVSEKRNKVNELTENLNDRVKTLDEHIDALSAALESDFNVDWAELRQTDTGEYLRLKDLKEARQEAITKAKKAREKAIQDRIPAEQQALLDAMPEWNDKEKGQKTYDTDIKLFNSYVGKLGFSAKEVKQMADHRIMKALFMAARYDNLKTSKPEPQKPKSKTKVSKPGTNGASDQPKTLGQVLYG